MVTRQTIRNQEREIATLKAQVNGTFTPTDLEFQNLSIEIEKQALEIARLKGRRIEKNRQITEWRRWMILCHEYAAVLRGDPKTEAPDPNWPPPSWRPDADEEKDDPEMAALVAGLRSEIEQLKSRNKHLSQSLQEAREQVKDRKAALTEGQDWGETLNILVDDIDHEQIAIALYEHDPDGAADLTDKMVIAFGKSLGEQTTEFAKFFKSLCDEPESSPLNALFEKAQRYDNPIFWLGADEAREYAETILKELGDPNYSEKKSNPTPEPPGPSPASGEPATGRGRHFGAYPDPDTMQRLRALSARLRLDNTALLRFLLENEYANPPAKLPPRRKRANRIHHFGCYPDAATWGKIQELLERYRIDNTELISHMAERYPE